MTHIDAIVRVGVCLLSDADHEEVADTFDFATIAGYFRLLLEYGG
jgi:hypothetical protein